MLHYFQYHAIVIRNIYEFRSYPTIFMQIGLHIETEDKLFSTMLESSKKSHLEIFVFLTSILSSSKKEQLSRSFY